MPLLGKSFVDVATITPADVFVIFDKARRIRDNPPSNKLNKSIGLLFFEPSTRTRASFETAAHMIGLNVLNLEPTRSSVVKGESVLDTLLNIQAMGVAAMVIRHSGSGVFRSLEKGVSVPLINGGDGTHQHPTQAMLDAFTIQEFHGEVRGSNVLIVGDLLYSRVARSNVELLQKLGARVAVCGPSTLVPETFATFGVEIFRDLEPALKWASSVMLLRMQLERQQAFLVPSLKEYHVRFGLTAETLKYFRKDGIILHPGPVNHGVEISAEAMNDPRVKVLDQVRNGVFVRAALLAEILGVAV